MDSISWRYIEQYYGSSVGLGKDRELGRELKEPLYVLWYNNGTCVTTSDILIGLVYGGFCI